MAKRGPKRTPVQLEAGRALVAELYLKGKSQRFIAQEVERQTGVTITVDQVVKDIAWCLRQWREHAMMDISEAKSREIAKINALETTYWEAWQDSRRPKESSLTEKTEGEKTRTRAGIRREQRDGNPAFLQGVCWCIDRRIRILGLDAPIKIDIEPEVRKMARDMGLDEDKAVAEANRIVRGR